jgi:hypothetical protein
MQDHRGMQPRSRLVLTAALALVTGAVSAGEAPKTDAGPKRELLKPPVKEIPSPITDHFAIRAMFVTSDITTLVRHDDSAGTPGSLIDGENTLGLPDRRQRPNLDMTFRMGKRHRIHADVYNLKRSGDEIISGQIRFGDAQFQPGERVVSGMELRKLGIGWTWSALRTERLEFGIGLALHLMQLDGELQAPARFERERIDAAGPFPSLAFDGTWRVTHRFSLNAGGNWLGGTADEVKGRFQSLRGDVQFRVRPNFALGLGYTQTLFRVESSTTDFSGYMKLKYKGPEAFLRVSF